MRIKLLGLYIAIGRWFGNCFSPALVLEWNGRQKPFFMATTQTIARPAWAVLTLRTKRFRETKVYWRGWWRFDFNSEHIAERWGKFTDTDFGGVWTYKGVLGFHQSF